MTDSVGFGRRFVANILEGLIIGLPIGFIGSYFLDDYQNIEDIMSSVQFLYLLILPIVWHGYTLGKRIVGIRIVRVDGKKVGIGTMLLRNVVGGMIYGLTLGLAAIVSAFMIGLREDNRGIHDFIAGTYVSDSKPETMNSEQKVV